MSINKCLFFLFHLFFFILLPILCRYYGIEDDFWGWLLWISAENKPRRYDDIPHCERCNLERWPEFQVYAYLYILLSVALNTLNMYIIINMIMSTILICWLLSFFQIIIIKTDSPSNPLSVGSRQRGERRNRFWNINHLYMRKKLLTQL